MKIRCSQFIFGSALKRTNSVTRPPTKVSNDFKPATCYSSSTLWAFWYLSQAQLVLKLQKWDHLGRGYNAAGTSIYTGSFRMVNVQKAKLNFSVKRLINTEIASVTRIKQWAHPGMCLHPWSFLSLCATVIKWDSTSLFCPVLSFASHS